MATPAWCSSAGHWAINPSDVTKETIMANLQTITDRVEIEALQAEITDAVMMHDYDRVASLFTEDAAVRIPDAHVELVSRKDIRTGIERMQGGWEFFVQNTHPGA